MKKIILKVLTSVGLIGGLLGVSFGLINNKVNASEYTGSELNNTYNQLSITGTQNTTTNYKEYSLSEYKNIGSLECLYGNNYYDTATSMESIIQFSGGLNKRYYCPYNTGAGDSTLGASLNTGLIQQDDSNEYCYFDMNYTTSTTLNFACFKYTWTARATGMIKYNVNGNLYNNDDDDNDYAMTSRALMFATINYGNSYYRYCMGVKGRRYGSYFITGYQYAYVSEGDTIDFYWWLYSPKGSSYCTKMLIDINILDYAGDSSNIQDFIDNDEKSLTNQIKTLEVDLKKYQELYDNTKQLYNITTGTKTLTYYNSSNPSVVYKSVNIIDNDSLTWCQYKSTTNTINFDFSNIADDTKYTLHAYFNDIPLGYLDISLISNISSVNNVMPCISCYDELGNLINCDTSNIDTFYSFINEHSTYRLHEVSYGSILGYTASVNQQITITTNFGSLESSIDSISAKLAEKYDTYYKQIYESKIESEKNKAYNEGVESGTNEGSTILNTFKLFLDYPVNFLTGVLNFEVFGINISKIVLFVITLGVVAMAIHFIKRR